MRLSSYDAAEGGIAFDEDSQSWVRLADLENMDPGDVADGEEEQDDDTEDADMSAEEEEKQVGQAYLVRSLKSENAKLKTQLAAALRKLEDMQAQREQELRDGERLAELSAAGMRQLGEMRQTLAEQDEHAMMRVADELARARHGQSYKRLAASDYAAALAVLTEAQRQTAY